MKVQRTDPTQASAEDVRAPRSVAEELATASIPDDTQTEIQARRAQALDELTALSEDMGLFR